MKYFLLPLFLLFALLAGDQQKTIFHDKDAEIRKVAEFHSVEISSAIDLQLSQGDEASVAISAPDVENRAGIKTVVNNGVLKIWYEQKRWFKGSGRKIRAYVSVKSLRMLKASGACDITVNGDLQTDEMAMDLNGASDFKGSIIANVLRIDLSGASDVKIRGKVDNLRINASGASHFKGYDLAAENCKIDASGASDIQITVNKELSAEASGATNIDYKGTGMIGDIKSSGASNIRKRS